jgi:hypothetical protein
MAMVEILCGEDWEHSENISTVPQEHWKWFLGAHVGTVSMRNIAGKARRLLANLRVLRDQKGWKHIGLENWEQTLNWFGLTSKQWEWLEAGEPVLTDNDSVEQGIEKGRSEMARQLKAENPELGPTAIGRMVGCDKTTVRDALNVGEIVPLEEVPPRISHPRDQADFRKLSTTGQERVRQGEPLNRVALAEGVRKRLSPLEQAQKAFRRLTREDRNAFALWLNEQPR